MRSRVGEGWKALNVEVTPMEDRVAVRVFARFPASGRVVSRLLWSDEVTPRDLSDVEGILRALEHALRDTADRMRYADELRAARAARRPRTR